MLQNCRIRWGTVTAVEGEHVAVDSRPLVFADGELQLGTAGTERVRWSRDGASLIDAPTLGSIVSAHWDWVCDTLSVAERNLLADATAAALNTVNAIRRRERTR